MVLMYMLLPQLEGRAKDAGFVTVTFRARGQETDLVGNFSSNKTEIQIYTFGRFSLNLNLLMPPSTYIIQQYQLLYNKPIYNVIC